MRSAVTGPPRQATPLAAVRDALTALASRYDTEEALAIERLMRSTEALRARKQANYEHQELSLYVALAEHWPDPSRRTELRLVALVGIGALRLTVENWGNDGNKHPLTEYLAETFTSLQAVMAQDIARKPGLIFCDAADRPAAGWDRPYGVFPCGDESTKKGTMMAGLLNRIKTFLRSPRGQQMTNKAREMAKDPRNRERAQRAADKLRRKR